MEKDPEKEFRDLVDEERYQEMQALGIDPDEKPSFPSLGEMVREGVKAVQGTKESEGFIEGCYTMSEIPGRKISRALGLVEYTIKGISSDAPNESREIFQNLLEVARRRGANAVVNVRLASGSYGRGTGGSMYEDTYIVAYGDAVVLE